MLKNTTFAEVDRNEDDKLSTRRPPLVINDTKRLRPPGVGGIILRGNAARSAPVDRSRSFKSEIHVGLQRVVVKTKVGATPNEPQLQIDR